MQKKVTWKSVLGAFIPQHVPNWVVCGVMSLLGALHRTSKRKREENRAHNVGILRRETMHDSNEAVSQKAQSPWLAPGAYIENQPQWEEVRFGNHRTIAYSGCELLAVYNARIALRECLCSLDLVELIGDFEREGAVWAAQFGVAPRAICKYFRKRGYDAQIKFRSEEGSINEMGEKFDTVIVTFYNDARDIFKMIHTVNISKNEIGKYWVHNCYKRQGTEFVSDGPYESLWNAIYNRGSGARAILCVIGIRKNSCIGGEKRV